MRRRQFLEVNTSPPAIGFLGGASAAGYSDLLTRLWESLSAQGFVDGGNVRIEYRWSEDQDGQLPALAADLLRLQPSVIIVVGTTAAIVAVKS
jgi:putative ABC transport system substrate-binding protein